MKPIVIIIISLTEPLDNTKQYMYVLIGCLSLQDGPILAAWDCLLRSVWCKKNIGWSGLKKCEMFGQCQGQSCKKQSLDQSIKMQKRNTASLQPSCKLMLWCNQSDLQTLKEYINFACIGAKHVFTPTHQQI